MSDNEMDGQYLGGGYIEHIVQGGEIYLSAIDIATIFNNSGLSLGHKALTEADSIMTAQAQALLVLGFKMKELRSELLRQEAEKSLITGD